MSEPVHRQLGLTDDEAARIADILGREPNHLELAMYGVMWSEHCSYKSSAIHLRHLPSEAPWVLVGPGEGAGVIDAGDGIAVAIRIESHNHPSAIEPYQGAATGVGGIIRDVFTMGARPIAVMDPLRFGTLDDPRTRWIFEGVVSGISGYGNSVGVPTVGGETVFDETFAGNPLVNVFCLGVMPKERLVLGRASGEGNLAILIGSSTGRDGIGGATMASEEFSDDEEAERSKRPNVQVGDPFEEKLLIEACLQLLDEGLVVGVQDLGAGGVTGATSETSAKGGVGMDVDVRAVHLREPGMDPWEIMLSESQERMLAIVTPANLDKVLEICRHWDVDASVIGRVTGSGRLRVLDGSGPDAAVLADIPAASLEEDKPRYDRPRAEPVNRPVLPTDLVSKDPTAELLDLLVDPSWVYRQYDHQLVLNTVEAPGGDAAVLKLKAPGLPPTKRGLAVSTDGNSRWCAVDPRDGMAMVVAESALNVACSGARPVALVNCLNFGNPEHPEVMWQLSEAVDGMAEACRVLGFPVIGGNVSLYNASSGVDIDPAPVVATLGLIETLDRRPPGVRMIENGRLVLLGDPDADTLGGSLWAKQVHGAKGGPLPTLDLVAHTDLVLFVTEIVTDGLAAGIHDVSEGGLAVCLAEMAVRSGVGCRVVGPSTAGQLFSEAPSRVVVCAEPEAAQEIVRRAGEAGVPASFLGASGGDRIVIGDAIDVSVAEARAAWQGAIPNALTPATH
ncbi:MAG: phosphoribosylformylglycinamidine synthase subunit PurL [Acidimicrobiia bacterium]